MRKTTNSLPTETRERINLSRTNSWIVGDRCKHSANSVCVYCQAEKEQISKK